MPSNSIHFRPSKNVSLNLSLVTNVEANITLKQIC